MLYPFYMIPLPLKNNFSLRNSIRTARHPYWLVLVFALFLAGQIASGAHWHDSTQSQDAECALCTLSNAVSGAITSSAWSIAVITAFIAVRFSLQTAPAIAVARCYDSRAPPRFS